ncbi:MAG: AsmA-like C-terminal region-containing protein [Balneolaceae bacterium]|nr:AsmA-like C-terminal region-containing protein [Balneolaceae bacterium]
MKRFLKIAGGIVLFLVMVAVGLNLWLTDERLKRTALPYLSEALGREVQAESMSLSFWRTFPRPGLSVGGLLVPGDAKGDTVMALERGTAGVALLPLLQGRADISEVHLRRPRFRYRIYGDGTTNMDFLFEQEDEEAAGGSWSISIPLFSVEGGEVDYRNDSTGTRAALHGLGGELSLSFDSLITSGAELRAEGLSWGSGGEARTLQVPVTLSQQSTVDTRAEILRLQDGSLSLRGLSLQLEGSVSNWSAGPDLDLSLKSSTDDFGELLALLPGRYVEGLQTRGSLTLQGTVGGSMAGGSAPSFAADLQVRDGYLKNPDLPRAIEDIRLNARADNQALTLTEFTAQAGQNTLRANGTLEHPLQEDGDFEAAVQADMDLSTLPEYYDVSTFGLQEMAGELAADVTFRGNRARPAEADYEGTFRLSGGSLRYAGVPEAITGIELDALARADRLELRSLRMQAAGNTFSTSGSIRQPLDSMRTVDLQSALEVDLSTLRRFYPVEGDSLGLGGVLVSLSGSARADLNLRGAPAEPAALVPDGTLSLTNVHLSGGGLPHPVRSLNGELRLTPSAATLQNLSFGLGDSQMELEGTMERYRNWLLPEGERNAAEPPRLTGTFRSNYLDMDQWINWEDTSSAPLAVHLPHLQSEVDAQIARMTLTGVNLSDVQGRLTGSPLELRLAEGSARLLGGSMSGSITWRVPRPERTEVIFEGGVDSLQLASFFEEYPVLGPEYRLHDYLQGHFDASVSYRTELDSLFTPVLATTDISGSFGMSRTRLEGHPIQQRVAALLDLQELRSATLDSWNSTFNVDRGVMRVDSLRLVSGGTGAVINGTRSLSDGTLDLQLTLYLPQRYREAVASVVTAQAVDALAREDGALMLPLRVTGTLRQPRIEPDRETIQPILETYLKDKAGSVLRRLFDNR